MLCEAVVLMRMGIVVRCHDSGRSAVDPTTPGAWLRLYHTRGVATALALLCVAMALALLCVETSRISGSRMSRRDQNTRLAHIHDISMTSP